MADRKRKRMTSAEKSAKTRMKREMQEKGILPPDKPKLNRKRYVDQAVQEWNGRDMDFCAWDIYLYEAIGIMIGKRDRNFRLTQEAVGAAKCLKLAVRLKEFSDRLKAEGRKEYTLGEEIEFIKDILDA